MGVFNLSPDWSCIQTPEHGDPTSEANILVHLWGGSQGGYETRQGGFDVGNKMIGTAKNAVLQVEHTDKGSHFPKLVACNAATLMVSTLTVVMVGGKCSKHSGTAIRKFTHFPAVCCY